MCNYDLLKFYIDLKANLGPMVMKTLKDFPYYEDYDNMDDFANSVFLYGYISKDLYVRSSIFNVLSCYGYDPYHPVYTITIYLGE